MAMLQGGHRKEVAKRSQILTEAYNKSQPASGQFTQPPALTPLPRHHDRRVWRGLLIDPTLGQEFRQNEPCSLKDLLLLGDSLLLGTE